jgi:hypothetical protein
MKKSIASPRDTKTGEYGTGCKLPWPALPNKLLGAEQGSPRD